MKKFLIGALVLVAVIAMVKTVPDKKAHRLEHSCSSQL